MARTAPRAPRAEEGIADFIDQLDRLAKQPWPLTMYRHNWQKDIDWVKSTYAKTPTVGASLRGEGPSAQDIATVTSEKPKPKSENVSKKNRSGHKG